MKKYLHALLCLSLFSFAGCGGPPKKDHITVWHWMTDRDKVFQEMARQYKEETGVDVVFELYAPSDVYSQKIIAAAQGRSLPDVFGILDKKAVVAKFINGGFVADLTPEFKKDNNAWQSSLFPKALAVNQFEAGNPYNVEPGIYGVPIDVTNIQMLYNKNLLRKAGISAPPQTFEEFLNVIDSVKRLGVSGLVSGWGELWMIDAFASNYAFNIMGEEKVMATYRGEVPYTDPDWVRVFEIFAKLRDQNALTEGIVTKANKYAEQDFALERAAFAFNGSWCVNVYNDMNSGLEYGVMLPPPVNGANPMKIWGGAGSSFVVNNVSPNKEEAVAFLKWLTAKEQQIYLSRETNNLPANRKALADIPPILSEFARTMDSTTHPTIWPVNEESQVIEAFDKGIQSIIIGEKTPQQVAADVQRVKEEEAAKKARRNR